MATDSNWLYPWFTSSSPCSGFPGVVDCILGAGYWGWVHNRYHFKKHLAGSDCGRQFLKLDPSLKQQVAK